MADQKDSRRLQCRHIHTDGRRCGSPCVRTQDFCYYHGKARHSGPRQPQVKTLADRKLSTFELPSPADLAERPGIQLALGQILHKIAHNEIDPRRAGLLLYGLQIASMNLPREATPKSTKAVDPEDLVDDLAEAPDTGTLAPVADWEDNRPLSSIEKLWEQYEREHPDTLGNRIPSINATAAATTPHPRRSGPKYRFMSTFDSKAGWGIGTRPLLLPGSCTL